jgi:hypothetical protein
LLAAGLLTAAAAFGLAELFVVAFFSHVDLTPHIAPAMLCRQNKGATRTVPRRERALRRTARRRNEKAAGLATGGL